MLCQFSVYSKVIQLYIYLFFFKFFSHLGYYRILSRVPCRIQQVLVYLFSAALGLRCCVQAFFGCDDQGILLIAVRRLLIVVGSLVAEHRLQVHRLQQLQHVGSVVAAHGLQAVDFNSCGLLALEHRLSSCARAQLLCSMWDLPGPGLKPMSPALAGRFLTTAPPGKSSRIF